MRIAFSTLSDAQFRVESVYQNPLGGSESGLCYLTEALARQGHEVFLLTNCLEPAVSLGVRCLYCEPRVVKSLGALDAFIIQNSAGWGHVVRPLLEPATRLALWTMHTHEEPAVQALRHPTERAAYDGFAFVSHWQRSQYVKQFGIDFGGSTVFPNVIAPAFGQLFPDSLSIVSQKRIPPLLAYTSTPFRGLEVLLDVLPEIHRTVPGTRLKVFSSMKVYHVNDASDEATFGHLYRRCREMEGVDYVGSMPQPQLAKELRSVALLAYANTFPETSSIAVLEAMAAGCLIVTSDLGAMPETTAGFAKLIPFTGSADADYRRNYVAAAVQALQQITGPAAAEAEVHLRRQVDYVNSSHTWSVRANQWVQWLSDLCSRTA
jgi:glycosyltransferase involved in cell wall biosynthesis